MLEGEGVGEAGYFCWSELGVGLLSKARAALAFTINGAAIPAETRTSGIADGRPASAEASHQRGTSFEEGLLRTEADFSFLENPAAGQKADETT
jgi:hypothetical protein